MSNHSIIRELKLHSPAGVEPAVFAWPSDERQVNKSKISSNFFID